MYGDADEYKAPGARPDAAASAAKLLAAVEGLATKAATIAETVGLAAAIAKASHITGRERTADGVSTSSVTLHFTDPATAVQFAALASALLPAGPVASYEDLARALDLDPLPERAAKAPPA